MKAEETCRNPWKRKPCGNNDVCVYIHLSGINYPICEDCWNRIARSDREW